MAKVSFIMESKGGKLDFLPSQKPAWDAFSTTRKDGFYTCAVEGMKRAKTLPQLAYWYGVVVPTAVEGFIEAGYDALGEIHMGEFTVDVRTDADTVDRFLKGLYRLHTGAKVVSKARMSTEEMSGLIDFAVRWIVTNLGVVVQPPPQELLTQGAAK